ncbi:MAG TPA: serine/threonine-protein kinase, partial [Thermomicrobiales bacterium]|nr:serine/threonine-protein kinase [Thermomicrobiales bacterium]
MALKMILAGAYAGAEERRRFANEAEAIAHLDHPNIVQVYEIGEADDRPFIALEFLEGGSLAARLAGKPQPPRAAAGMIATLADAVEFAHQRGIVHRDLKPANVMFDRHGTMKITDFGLAKQLAAGAGATRTGDVMGTPAYMAPEQAGGAAKQVGPACDIYALGVMLYEMLTGRPPFHGQESVDTLLAVLTEEPLPPRRLTAHIPRDLETICLKCLEKSPARRYASAGELAADLRRFLNNEPIAARPPGAIERAAKWVRRHPARAIAAAASFLLLAASSIGFAYHSQTLARQLAETDRQRQRAEADLDLALDTVDELVDRLSAENLAGLAKNDPIRREFLEITLAFCQGLLGENPGEPGVRWRMARARRQAASIQQIFGHAEQAEAEYRQAIRDLDQLVAEFLERPEYRRDLAAAHNNLGNLLRAQGRAKAAEDENRIAQQAFQQLCDESPDDADFRQQLAVSWNNLALSRLAAGDAAGAEEAQQRALSLYQALEQKHPDAAEIVQALAGAYGNL